VKDVALSIERDTSAARRVPPPRAAESTAAETSTVALATDTWRTAESAPREESDATRERT
jgi:hypothetical protein